MSRSPADVAAAAIERVLKARAAAVQKVAACDAELAKLRGLALPEKFVAQAPRIALPAYQPPPEDDEEGEAVEAELSPGDNMGQGRWL
jgi:hypothetical protein